jgi:deoxyribose-phosphate aldolase
MDLTSLTGEESEADIHAFCERARNSGVAAVCVYDKYARLAVTELASSDVRVAAVTAGFPIPELPLTERLRQIRWTAMEGADEIDVVVTRQHALTGEWEALYDEVAAFKETCGAAKLKVILATGELPDQTCVFKASMAVLMAGADFIKTSTGRETVNATLEAGETMASAIATFAGLTGLKVGLKPAGGIRTASQALDWVALVQHELGNDWLTPERFRLGASSLLDDVQRRLESS